MLTFTTLYTDQFTPSANPLSAVNWTLWAATPSNPYRTCEAVAVGAAPGYCIPTTLATDPSFNGNGEYLSSVVMPNDQFCSVVMRLLTVGAGGVWDIYVRAATDLTNCYFLFVEDNGDGTVKITLGDVKSSIETDPVVLPSVAFADGDIFAIAAVGSTVYGLRNGVQIGSFTDATPIASGDVGFDIFASTNSATDVQLATFTAGHAAITTGGGGGSTGLNDENFRLVF